MHVIFLGGPEHGRSLELPSDQTSMDVANLTSGTKSRYTLRVSEAVSSKPPSAAYFVLGSINGKEADALVKDAIAES